jgi:hypothetical protein
VQRTIQRQEFCAPRHTIGIRDIDELPLRAIPAELDVGSALDQRALSDSRSPHSHAGLVAECDVLSCRKSCARGDHRGASQPVSPTSPPHDHATARCPASPCLPRWTCSRSTRCSPRSPFADPHDGQTLDRHHHTARTPHVLRGPRRTQRQATVGRPVRRIPLTRDRAAVLADRIPDQIPYPRKEIIARLLRRRCELCEDAGKVVVHQVRKLASLGEPGSGQPPWAALMARKQRKTLVVCHPCHETIHHGQPIANTA